MVDEGIGKDILGNDGPVGDTAVNDMEGIIHLPVSDEHLLTPVEETSEMDDLALCIAVCQNIIGVVIPLLSVVAYRGALVDHAGHHQLHGSSLCQLFAVVDRDQKIVNGHGELVPVDRAHQTAPEIDAGIEGGDTALPAHLLGEGHLCLHETADLLQGHLTELPRTGFFPLIVVLHLCASFSLVEKRLVLN